MRFLGYGIAWIEDVDDRGEPREEVAAELASAASETFGPEVVVSPDPATPGRYLAACPEGHVPGAMELSHLSSEEDWEDLRRTADASGSEAMRERVSMLEGHKA